MKTRTSILLYLFVLLLGSACSSGKFDHFVTRNGDQLMDGEKPLHFVSYNIPNLHYIEDQLPFEETNPWRLPNEFEIRDGLKAIAQANGKVTRIYVLSVRNLKEDSAIVRHVLAPGRFNEEAFVALDQVFKVANEEGVRVILPLVDNWKWWGGPAEYAAFRGKEADAFWTDPELIADFKKTVEFMVNRVNTLTGVPYKEDKALFGWETGNELGAPYSWAAEIAAYIKSLDQNHLVIEGRRSNKLDSLAVNDPNLDIMTTHHYQSANDALPIIESNLAMTKGKKPYFIGEIGLNTFAELKPIIDYTVDNKLAGVMLWSLRFRSRDGGFYNHTEWNGVMPCRWPGFAISNHPEENTLVSYLREKAFAINGEELTPIPAPGKPVILPIPSVYKISWQGSAGAVSYDIERQEEGKTEWSALATDISDAITVHRPLFADETAEPGKSYRYRVSAKNQTGKSDPSEASELVTMTDKMLIDDFTSGKKMNSCDTTVRFLVMKDLRKAKEDKGRIEGSDGSQISYRVAEPLKSITLDAFHPSDSSLCGIETSSDGTTWMSVKPVQTRFSAGKNEYGFFLPVRYQADLIGKGQRYVKIKLFGRVQPGHLELVY
ncbi:MAG: cellulase family glycosylhydrolase [Bacteroidetes bacterium]|nr:cellulase family glycosylhydrolase [Bacteroidota bacterium]